VTYQDIIDNKDYVVRFIVEELGHPQKCEECGKMDELRPYGENGQEICYDCGKNNPHRTYLAYARLYAEEMYSDSDQVEKFMDYVKVDLMEHPDKVQMP
jgi:hypothetical protein